MARLSNEDLHRILGPDYARKMKADLERAEPNTAEERAAAAKREAAKLEDFRFTLVAVIAGGFALVAGSYFNKAGLDVQAMTGAVGVLAGVAGFFAVNAKLRKLVPAKLAPAQG